MNNPQDFTDFEEQSINDYIKQYTKYWYLFVLGIMIALGCAYVYLRYAERTYNTSSTIIVKDESKGGGAAELAAFSELSYFQNAFSDNMESELVILQSKTLIAQAVKNLDLNVRYFFDGNIKTSELYEYVPFKVKYLSIKDTLEQLPPQLDITVANDESFELSYKGGSNATHQFGDVLNLSFGSITVLPNQINSEDFRKYLDKKINVTYTSVEAESAKYQSLLNVNSSGIKSEVVNLSIESPIPARAEDFINQLVYVYNQDAINDKSLIAKKTSKFIDSRLAIITKELDSVESNKEYFKSSNRLTDIDAEAQIVLQSVNEFDKRQVDTSTQLEIVNSMVEYMEEAESGELLPSSIGAVAPEVTPSVNTYNQLILERNNMLQNATGEHPVVKNLNAEISQLQSTIVSSLKSQQQNYKMALRDLNYQESKLNSKLSRVPTQEKMFRGIVRQQNIKEQLYLFLLQQREETNISLAVTSAKAKVVDPAFSGKTPVAPKKSFIYLIAFVLGLLLPFLAIYIYNLLDTKIANRRDVEKGAKGAQIIGEIPRLRRNEDDLVKDNDHSILAESFRILRTNLQYLLVNKKESIGKNKRIFVTSTIKGEGKTFVAFNLALTLAATGKKVVLIGADIRNPQLQRYLPSKHKSNQGLTEYIVDKSIKIDDIANQSDFNPNLDLILSGAIPPNPAELLMNTRVGEFFEEVTPMYDYVIVDTAPSMLVTDTMILNEYTQTTLYVIRAGYTDKKLLEFPQDAIKENRLSNVSFVLNNVRMSNFGYGNKYGYTYTAEKKSFWNRLFNN